MEKEASYISVIKEVLASKGLSQQKFADMIGVNQTTVSQWLLGRKKPGYDNIYAICTRFGISPNEFFGL